ncbi:MAG TPA: protease pro-enzyme activation domain-containing protein [Candidatus Sulfotelmatobacter sp.]|nr:protease pro-enzyme activation domain-containing protein [Candidatus Sulfotelmatobacter sp.]
MRLFSIGLWCLLFAVICADSAMAQESKRLITSQIDESRLVALGGNTPPAAFRAENDRGAVADDARFEQMLLLLKRDPETEARLQKEIEAMHNPASPEFHHWLTPEEIGAQFGMSREDLGTIQQWLVSHGFTVNRTYKSGLVVDFSGTAKQIRETFHTEIHNLVLPNGEKHLANMRDPQIPAALAPAVEGVPLHDFFARPRVTQPRPISYDRTTGRWNPRFTVPFQGLTFFVVAPYDFATIYNLLPLWNRGITGKGVTIATVEDTNLAHPEDWSTFRQNFGLTGFKRGNFKQVYPDCENPGANGDEGEAALDVEWASSTAPDANVELSACAPTNTTSGLDLAILNLLETSPPDIISDSYGLCETITGQAEIALENFEAELATIEGVTFFIAQGDTGADECAPVEPTNYAILGINSGDNTASAFAVDVGGTDFMAQYNSDANGIPVTNYWSLTNNPVTLASALSYIPEIPWNDGCTSRLIYTDPVNGSFTQSFGANGFCNSTLGQEFFLIDVAGSGGPSTCFTGTPSIPGVVSGTCRGNPKPPFQFGVPGVPNDGLRDQPDLSLFASNGVWNSFYPLCLSDTSQGGTTCTAENDAIFLGAGGTSFSSPAMAGILGLIEQRFGKQGDANFVLYPLAAQQFFRPDAFLCNASQTSGKLPASFCVFNDVTLGDIDIPCGQNPDGHFYDCHGATSTLIGELSTSDSKNRPAYPATVGYDLATGLGSVNATNLFEAWPQFTRH